MTTVPFSADLPSTTAPSGAPSRANNAAGDRGTSLRRLASVAGSSTSHVSDSGQGLNSCAVESERGSGAGSAACTAPDFSPSRRVFVSPLTRCGVTGEFDAEGPGRAHMAPLAQGDRSQDTPSAASNPGPLASQSMGAGITLLRQRGLDELADALMLTIIEEHGIDALSAVEAARLLGPHLAGAL